MKYYALLFSLFSVVFCIGQNDTIIIDYKHVFHAGQSQYDSIASSKFSGVVKMINGPERYVDRPYISYNDLTCDLIAGKRTKCKTITYQRAYDAHSGERYTPWISATHLIYFKADGLEIDSFYTFEYNFEQQVTFQSHMYLENGNSYRIETQFINGDTLFHGLYLNKEMEGLWKESIVTLGSSRYDTIIGFTTIYAGGNLIDVLHKKVLFLDDKNNILEKSAFFKTHPNLKNNNFQFLAITDQTRKISDSYELILTVNKAYFNYGIPEKVLKKLIRNLKKDRKKRKN